MELLGTDGHWEDGNISGMDVVGDRFLVAADYKKKCMRCFDMDSGKQQVEWHDSGFLPRDITTIPGNRVAVTSAQEVWFLRVTENGDLLLENKINVKEDCYGIASSGNNLIVGRDHEVHMLDMKGKVIKEFKKDGDGKSLFDWPTSVAVSSDHSTIYITDKVNYTVTALTQDGCVLGVVDIEVLLPFESGITVDSAGRVYVCGFDNVFLVSIETGTVTPLLGITDGIRHPICVAVCDKTQCLYVSSLDSNVIQVFEMHNTLRRKI
ncbi:uncharacterized protein LOC128224789 isoform X2 [Mya arenaria]|nr:uncharacterized protein LOC128224789 isoform X2 [Mya arenaria]XP_052790801.1 uncharacterized protein LOC128224789 isoform X2 [Mya arenaria]